LKVCGNADLDSGKTEMKTKTMRFFSGSRATSEKLSKTKTKMIVESSYKTSTVITPNSVVIMVICIAQLSL
jgi:hypothetical protein